MSRFRVLFTVACLAVAAVLVGVTWFATRTAPEGNRVISTGTAAIGGPFTLVDQNGRTVDQSILQGKWTAVFFGFTYCPDVCPMTLQKLEAAQRLLTPEERERLQIVLISVDPERDTPEALKAYLESDAFPPGVVGLTGTPEQVATAARAYKAYYRKTGEGQDYLVDHATAVYLMDPEGVFARPVTGQMTPEAVAQQIRDAMRKGA